jgi:spermidine/putrescine transport system substrate-binding protein
MNAIGKARGRIPLRMGLLALALHALMPLATTVAHANERAVTILTWSDFLDPALVRKFEAGAGVELREVFIDSDDMRDRLLLNADGEDFDLAFVDGNQVDLYRKRGWLSALPVDAMPNLRHIDPVWAERYPASTGHAMPFLWGTTGIAYRSDLVTKPIRSWLDLFQPTDELCGRIMIQRKAQDTVETALRALGKSPATDDPVALNEAERLMVAQRNCVIDYGYMNLDEHSELLTGEVWAAMAYSGDALMIQQHNSDVAFVLPKEGSEVWMDFLVVFEKSTHKELALSFVNFMAEPGHAAQQALYSFYATPNLAAIALLPEDFRNNPVIYPGAEALSRATIDQASGPRLARRHNQIMFRVLP